MQPIDGRATEQKGWLYREDCLTAFPGTAFRFKCQLCLSSRPLGCQLRPLPSRLMVLRPAERLSILTMIADLVTCQPSKGMRQFLTLNQFHAFIHYSFIHLPPICSLNYPNSHERTSNSEKSKYYFSTFPKFAKKKESIQYCEWCSNLQ